MAVIVAVAPLGFGWYAIATIAHRCCLVLRFDLLCMALLIAINIMVGHGSILSLGMGAFDVIRNTTFVGGVIVGLVWREFWGS